MPACSFSSSTRIFFVKSTVCHGSLSADEMYEFLRDTVDALRDQKFTVIRSLVVLSLSALEINLLLKLFF